MRSLGTLEDSPTNHQVLGGRAALVGDVPFSSFTTGLAFTYRAGVPLSGAPDAWEGAFSLALRLGVAFDFGASPARTD